MLPLVDSHIQFLPLLFEGLVGLLLPHLFDSQILEKPLVLDQIVIHVD